ncbi:hypothetical protein RA280_38950 [Cupriavidus sp. CV2]|uniref:hypothetical protein n=1 Tax=Cupriavidus ulmosensis TaxID=3065913 RepID=UPI00296B49C6|nr:hypothetical protein [Cupriavidus sp. CV2]MDW3687612.1 hypothetical protein [Cupriavidus sp. CV2]
MLKRFVVAFAIAASAAAMGAPSSESANLKPAHSTAFAERLYAAPASGAKPASNAVIAPATPASTVMAPTAAPAVVQASEPVAASRPSTSHEASSAAASKPDESKWGSLSDRVVAIGTAILGVFTFLLWWSTRGLLAEAKGAGKTAEMSAKSALASAEAAVESVRAITASEQPRWLVTEMSMKLNPIAPIEPRWAGAVRVVLRNVGRSPAEVTGTAIAIAIGKLPTVPDYSRASKTLAESFGSTVLPGQDSQPIIDTFGPSIGLDEARVVAINNGEPMWVYGYIEYRDYLDRPWVKGFIGQVTSSVTWFPFKEGPDEHRGGGSFQPAAMGRGVDAYTYMRLQDDQA